MRTRKMIVSVITLALVSLPAAVWFLYKPSRIVMPEAMGMTRVADALYVDDPTYAHAAQTLYTEALAFVDNTVGRIRETPKTVFCSTEACAETFGLGRRSAVNLGTFDIIVGPQAWEPYYVRHEMIHHLQNERFGMAGVLRMPEWFIEGMAYALSGDPRSELSEPFDTYRTRFGQWREHVGRTHFWEQAQRLKRAEGG